MQTVTDFIFLGSKITEDGNCSHEIKRPLFLGRKAMTNLENVLKSRDITLPTKVHIVKATVFWVVVYGCEHWTIKKAECQRTDAFELWCWNTLMVHRTARRSNQLVLKEITWIFIGNTDAEAKAPIFWPDAKSRLILKDLDAGKSWGQEEKGMTEDEVVGWHHQINGNAFELTVRDSEGQGSLACCSPL